MKEELSLRQLRPGERGRVLRLQTRGALRRRLRDLGLAEGTDLRCLGRSPLGDPAAYEIRGAMIALRDADSAGVIVERL